MQQLPHGGDGDDGGGGGGDGVHELRALHRTPCGQVVHYGI